jgi:hypothetical protein
MRIAQIVFPDASWYERKCQAVDHALLSARHEVIVTTFEGAAAAAANVAHVYAAAGFAAPPASFTIPWLATAEPRKSRFRWRAAPPPNLIASPLENLPEAVAENYFAPELRPPRDGAHMAAVFTAGRPGVLPMIEQTAARIQRFRDDVQWLVFQEPPTPDDLLSVDVWVDPATVDDDLDGFVAEASVASKVVVASRTPINLKRLDKGMSGFLVPPRDPNELAHAILAALFKSEVALKKIEGARQTSGKFRPRQRLRVLEKLYETVTT